MLQHWYIGYVTRAGPIFIHCHDIGVVCSRYAACGISLSTPLFLYCCVCHLPMCSTRLNVHHSQTLTFPESTRKTKGNLHCHFLILLLMLRIICSIVLAIRQCAAEYFSRAAHKKNTKKKNNQKVHKSGISCKKSEHVVCGYRCTNMCDVQVSISFCTYCFFPVEV